MLYFVFVKSSISVSLYNPADISSIERDMSNKEMNGPQKGAYAPEPRIYELGYHLIPILGEEDVEKEREALVATITTLDGEVIDEEKPALINLAYTMYKKVNNKKTPYDQAYFGWIKFRLSPDELVNVKKDVEREDNILRYLLIQTVEENTNYSDQPYKLAKQTQAQDDEEFDQDEIDIDEDIVDEDDIDEEKLESLLDEKDILKQAEKGEEINQGRTDEEADDLTRIEGIGPKIAEIFSTHGITSFKKLASTAVEKLREILKENKLASHDPETWPEQAKLAEEGRWEELDALQEELKGGKRE